MKTIFAALMQIPSAWLNAIQDHVHDGVDADGHCPFVPPNNNAIHNGCCRVVQRAALALANNTWGFGKVDRFAGKVAGTALTAGSLTQATTAAVGVSGCSLHFSGITVTGAGVVSTRQRIESLNSLRFKNQKGSFACKVLHDTGAPVDYTVIIRKANAGNNFGGGTTVIATSAAQTVASGAATTVKLENIAMGDCSNGIEIEVQAACGAVVTKNFHFTAFGFYEGEVAQPFIEEDISPVTLRCKRSFQAGRGYGYLYLSVVGTRASIPIPMKVPMCRTPDFAATNVTGTGLGVTGITVGSITITDVTAVTDPISNAAGQLNPIAFDWTLDAELT